MAEKCHETLPHGIFDKMAWRNVRRPSVESPSGAGARYQVPLEKGRVYEEVLVSDLKRTTLVQYAGASGDFNPPHTDEVLATRIAGYPSVLAHGMLTMGITGRLVTDLFGAENVVSFGGRFTAVVFPGDTLTATMTIDAVSETTAEISLVTRNQDGVVVFSGYATGRIAGVA